MSDKLKMHTPNKADDNFKKLAALFPNAVTETIIGYDEKNNPIMDRAIDKDILMQEISATVVEGADERYQFTWPDKKKSILLANAPINKTLRPCQKESVNFDTTENLYIEGDNLEVLKLLQETYLGKIKMIYIDPPYNTGNDCFVYDDKFEMNTADFSALSNQYDENGNLTFDMRDNNEGNGRFHTDWLNMIYPRLKLAKDLLSDKGVIFISIDEHEVENLTKLCDEVFGQINHIGTFVIKSNPRGSMSTSEIASLHEHLLLYSKDRLQAEIIGHELSSDMESEYKFNDDKGAYRLLGLRMRGGFWRRTDRPKLYYPIYVNPSNGQVALDPSDEYSEVVFPIQPSTNEDGTWRWSKEKVLSDSEFLIGKQVSRNGDTVWDIYQKDYLEKEGKRRTKAKSIWEDSEINYQNGAVEIKELFNKSGIFDYSKPTFLISQALKMIKLDKGDIILDFFSGSATTAHSTMKLNVTDENDLKFILIQLPELTNEKTEAYKAGYRNICEIGKERIRRAAKKIAEENPNVEFDGGFRVLKCDSSNMKDVYYNPSEFDITMFDSLEDNIKEDRTPEDLLFQVMLELGVLLSSKIEETVIAGKKVFNVANNFLIACFDEKLTTETIKAIAEKKPYYFVMRDNGFADDSVATNFEQIFATFSPDTVRKVL